MSSSGGDTKRMKMEVPTRMDSDGKVHIIVNMDQLLGQFPDRVAAFVEKQKATRPSKPTPTHSYTVSCDLTDDDNGEHGETRVVRFYDKSKALRFAHEQAYYWVNLGREFDPDCPECKVPFDDTGCYNNFGKKDPYLANGYYTFVYNITTSEHPISFQDGEIVWETDNPRQYGMNSYKRFFPPDSVTFTDVYKADSTDCRPEPKHPETANQHWTY